MQEQNIAVGQFPDPRRGLLVHRPVEDSRQQRVALGTGQRFEVQATQVGVLPQGGHGVGDRLAAAQGGDHRGRTAPGQLVDDERGEVVEQMGVVDGH